VFNAAEEGVLKKLCQKTIPALHEAEGSLLEVLKDNSACVRNMSS